MISICNVSHTYNVKLGNEILKNISLEIPDGKFVILLGQSGSGKSTLLNIIAGLLQPTKGEVIYNGESLYQKNNDQLCEYRFRNVGFIFQNYFLENCYTAEENVIVPLILNNNMNTQECKARAEKLLGEVLLGDKSKCKPTELSGGECQRIAIARALANDPKIIIADEPTGNLDSANGKIIVEMLKSQTKSGKTVLMVTHNEDYVRYADIVYRIFDGEIYEYSSFFYKKNKRK